MSGVLVLTDPKVALMFVVPTFRATASPLVVMEAMDVVEDFHVAVPVTSWMVPSSNVAVAVNCCVKPSGNEIFVGETTMDTADAELTVSTVMPVIVPEVAVMFVLPPATAFATPAVGDVVLTVATEGLEELHVTELVRF